ncbi:MAG: hypothetical protein K8F62_11515 [Pseudorhodoplanes sp.]|nr:hypothetical protein [Pseudorhodoplanes sp.]
MAKSLCTTYGLDAFIADVEPGNMNGGVEDHWDPELFKTLISTLSTHFGKRNFGISTFAKLDVQPHCKAMMQLVPQHVSFFAPQVYWGRPTLTSSSR